MKRKRVEFHVHTRYSSDSMLNKYLLLVMCLLKKIEVIAITDHNTIEGAKKYFEFFKRFGIEIIVGEEIMTDSGEIVGLYLKNSVKPYLTVEQTIKEIKKQGGMVYLPHPYDEKRKKTVLKRELQEKYKNEFDFIEIHNGRNVDLKYDLEQKKIMNNLKVQAIIGGDAHTFFEIGRNYIEMIYENQDTLKENVKNGIFHQSACINLAHSVTKIVRILKMIGRGDFCELYRNVRRKCKRKHD